MDLLRTVVVRVVQPVVRRHPHQDPEQLLPLKSMLGHGPIYMPMSMITFTNRSNRLYHSRAVVVRAAVVATRARMWSPAQQHPSHFHWILMCIRILNPRPSPTRAAARIAPVPTLHLYHMRHHWNLVKIRLLVFKKVMRRMLIRYRLPLRHSSIHRHGTHLNHNRTHPIGYPIVFNMDEQASLLTITTVARIPRKPKPITLRPPLHRPILHNNKISSPISSVMTPKRPISYPTPKQQLMPLNRLNPVRQPKTLPKRFNIMFKRLPCIKSVRYRFMIRRLGRHSRCWGIVCWC